jgi:hypothetical protein
MDDIFTEEGLEKAKNQHWKIKEELRGQKE